MVIEPERISRPSGRWAMNPETLVHNVTLWQVTATNRLAYQSRHETSSRIISALGSVPFLGDSAEVRTPSARGH